MGMLSIFKPKKDTGVIHLSESGPTAIVQRGESPFIKYQVKSMVSVGMVVDGNLTSDRGAAIDGVVNGDVSISNISAALLIRAGGLVRGRVKAPYVMVSGEVHGSIEARFVRLYPGSRVSGVIKTDRLLVDDGATIINEGVGAGASGKPVLTLDTPVGLEQGQARTVLELEPLESAKAKEFDAGPVFVPAQRVDARRSTAGGGASSEDFIQAMQKRVGEQSMESLARHLRAVSA